MIGKTLENGILGCIADVRHKASALRGDQHRPQLV